MSELESEHASEQVSSQADNKFERALILEGQNIVVFDCEIVHEVDGKEITWNDHHKMNLSVATLYDYRSMESSVYMKDNVDELFLRLHAADMVVGFNIEGFDIPLLQAEAVKHPLANAPKLLQSLKTYDILYWSRRAMGWKPQDRFPTGMKLDNHLEATFGANMMKTANGADAPKMWQRGEYGRCTSYCLADVKREAKLFERAWMGLPIHTAAHGAHVLQSPQELLPKFHAARISEQEEVLNRAKKTAPV